MKLATLSFYIPTCLLFSFLLDPKCFCVDCQVEAETATEPEIKEEPLVDLSEPQPEAEKKKAAALSAEFSELTVSAPEAVEPAVAKEDTPAAEQVTATVEEVVEEKAKEAKETQVVADEESEAKVSA